MANKAENAELSYVIHSFHSLSVLHLLLDNNVLLNVSAPYLQTVILHRKSCIYSLI